MIMAPKPADITPSRHIDHFELVLSSPCNGNVTVKKYRSNRTGLNVVFANVSGPIVHAYLAVGTEAFDDDGIPHTLEHLIFLGSEDYPYKGFLDTIANRCFASGTNAWTDSDHTAYTLSTAGAAGLITMLPIYMDHVLHPTLTDAGYTTEVHHITGDGKDGGVVYCEMEGRESVASNRIEYEMLRLLYPGNCGYRYETGGIVKNIRESTNITKIREYHAKYYRPENLTCLIVGNVSEDDVFKALFPVEEKILSKGYRAEYVKPWQSPVPTLEKYIQFKFNYPSDVEENGLVYVGWQGPPYANQFELLGCISLLKYMTDTPASPLIVHFVEMQDAFCSDVDFSIYENGVPAIFVEFEDVDLDKMNNVEAELLVVLRKMVTPETEYYLDMNRMDTIIKKWQMKLMSKMERNPHHEISRTIIKDMLYNTTVEETIERLNPVQTLSRLLETPVSFWKDLLRKYFIEQPLACVLAYPSKEEFAKTAREEKSRIEEQQAALGKAGLAEKARILENANLENEKEAPDAVITSIPVPQIEDPISFYKIDRYSKDSEQQHPLFNMDNCPIYMYLDDVKTYFLYMYMMIDTDDLPAELRLYLPVLMEYIIEAPILRDGKLIPHEEVAKELENDLLSLKSDVGMQSRRFLCGSHSNVATICFQIEPEAFVKSIYWMRTLLYDSKILEDRVKVLSNKIIKSASQWKRNGFGIVHDMVRSMIFKPDTNVNACMALNQQAFLTDMIKQLNKGGEDAQKVIQNLEAVRAIITNPKNMAIHFAANVEALSKIFPDPSSHFQSLLPENVSPIQKRLQIKDDYDLQIPFSEQLHKNCIAGTASVDSAYLLAGVQTINDYNHPDLPALMVFLSYICQTEGPLWRQIRGLGLAYSFDIDTIVNEGVLYLNLYRCTNVLEAYKRTKEIVLDQMSESKWSKMYFDASKSCLIFEIIEREKNVKDAINQSIYAYLNHVDQYYNSQLVRRVLEVDMADMVRIGQQYVAPLFDNSVSRTSIVCNGSKCADIAAEFAEIGINLKMFPTVEESYLNPSPTEH